MRVFHDIFKIGMISGCEGSPLLPLLYIATNLMFNISVLNLVKSSSAVVSSLAVMLSGSICLLYFISSTLRESVA